MHCTLHRRCMWVCTLCEPEFPPCMFHSIQVIYLFFISFKFKFYSYTNFLHPSQFFEKVEKTRIWIWIQFQVPGCKASQQYHTKSLHRYLLDLSRHSLLEPWQSTQNAENDSTRRSTPVAVQGWWRTWGFRVWPMATPVYNIICCRGIWTTSVWPPEGCECFDGEDHKLLLYNDHKLMRVSLDATARSCPASRNIGKELC